MISIPPNTIKWLTLVFLCVHLTSFAQQLSFNKSKQNKMMSFNYTWTDHQEQTIDISFALPLDQLNKQIHRRFVPDVAQQYVYIELLKAARKINPKQASVKVQHRGQALQIQVTSRSNDLLVKWQRLMKQSQEKALEQYLQESYYSHFHSHLGQKAVKPDHLRYIAENAATLAPVAKALYNTLPNNSARRVYVNLLLSWVQSIPYNELKNRLTSNGAGYLPPLSVVANNQGDCDSKTVLMASLLRSILPTLKMSMVFLPNHALLAIELPFRSQGQTLYINGTSYVLMEPTGPAKTPLGEIAASSARYIAGNTYSVEEVP